MLCVVIARMSSVCMCSLLTVFIYVSISHLSLASSSSCFDISFTGGCGRLTISAYELFVLLFDEGGFTRVSIRRRLIVICSSQLLLLVCLSIHSSSVAT